MAGRSRKKAPTEEGQLRGDGTVRGKGRKKKSEVAVITDPILFAQEMASGFGKLLGFRNNKKALKAEHIDPITKKEGAARKTLCAMLGTDWEDLKPHFQIYCRSNDADEMEDEGDRERVRSNLQRAWNGLSDGGQLDWLAAVGERAPANEDEEDETLDVERMTLEQAEEHGFNAQQAGKTASEIPAEIAAMPALAKGWKRGWDKGTEAAIAKMTGKAAGAAAVH